MNQDNSTSSVMGNISTPNPLIGKEDSQTKARQAIFGVIAAFSFFFRVIHFFFFATLLGLSKMNQDNSTSSVMGNISTPNPLIGKEDSQTKARQAIFGVIAAFSFLLNFLFCVIMMRKPAMLKRPHNILLFSLAFTDLLAGIFLPLTPGYVISIASFPVPQGLSGEIFCRVLSSRYALFTVGKVSILKVTCLAIDRWYCIFRPMTYKRYFTRKKLFLYILAIWVCICLLQLNKFFEWKLSGRKCSKVKAPYGKKGTQAMIIIYSLIGFYIPCFIAWASFGHIILLFKTSPMARCYGERQRAQQKALLRMCAVTSITLTLCWLPAQTIYILSPFGLTKIGSPLHRAGGILATFNSCINPLIYWMTNREYRAGLCEIFALAKVKSDRKRSYKFDTPIYLSSSSISSQLSIINQ